MIIYIFYFFLFTIDKINIYNGLLNRPLKNDRINVQKVIIDR